MANQLIRGMIYQHSESDTGWSSYLVKMYVINDIQTYTGHRYIQMKLKEDYSMFGYEPAKYDVFIPETGDQTSRYMAHNQPFMEHNTPVVLETISDDTLIFKPIFDLDVNVLVTGTYTYTALVTRGLQTVWASIFSGLSQIATIDININNTWTVTYDNPTSVTMAEIWETTFNSLVISTYYTPYYTLEYANNILSLSADMISVKFIPIKLQTNQILDVDQTTNYDSTEGCNIVGGYLQDGTFYKYIWLDNTGYIHFSPYMPESYEIHTSLVLKYVEIDSADDGSLQAKGATELERTISSHQSELDLKLNLKDLTMTSLQINGWIYLIGYLQDKPLIVHLREIDFQTGYVIVGSNSNLSMV